MSYQRSNAPRWAFLCMLLFMAGAILWPWPVDEPGCRMLAGRNPFTLAPTPAPTQLGMPRHRAIARRELVAERIGGNYDLNELLDRLGVAQRNRQEPNASMPGEPPAAPVLTAPELTEIEEVAGPRWHDLNAELAAEPQLESAQPLGPAEAEVSKPSPGDDSRWVVPHALLQRLAQLERSPGCRDWAIGTAEIIRQLGDDDGGLSDRVRQLLAEADAAEHLAGTLRDGSRASELRRARYALLRHLVMWRGMADLEANHRGAIPVAAYHSSELIPSLQKVAGTLQGSQHEAGWRLYLMLEPLENAALQVSLADSYSTLARRALRRIESPLLNDAQRRFMQLPAYRTLVAELRRLADEPIDTQELLAKFEAYEASGRMSLASLLASDLDRLRLSPRGDERAFALQLESYYRNTNVRMSVSQDLLAKLVAGQHSEQGKVQGQMWGVPYHGQQMANTTTKVTMLPGQDPLQLLIETQGRVVADTAASQGPVTTQNRSISHFTVQKRIEFDRGGLRYFPAEVTVRSQQALCGVDTQFDGVPVMGGLMRNITARRYEDQRGEAVAITRQKLRQEVAAATDATADAQLAQLQAQLERNMLLPLERLSLTPAAVVERPADDRLNVRMRLATYRQMGAHTPRPVAPADSLASVQLHETALNNLLDRLPLAGRELSLAELWKATTPDLASENKLIASRKANSGDRDYDVRLHFANYDPLQVQCLSGKLRATLRLTALHAGFFHWERLTVHADFEPVRQGRNVYLVRTGPVLVAGGQLSPSQRNLVQTLLTSLMPAEAGLPLFPPALLDHQRMADVAVTQAVVEDGWLGLAVGPAESLRTARRGERQANFNR